jgi:hypothetical protein
MATATAVQQQSSVLHTRGTWSARDDRTCAAVVLGLLWIGMIAGFGLDFPFYLHQVPAPPLILHVHAVVFTIWMLLVTAQILFVVGDRVSVHRKFGWVLVAWVGLMAILGPWAAIAMQANRLRAGHAHPQFLALNLVDISSFLVLLGFGIALRKNPAAHKRMMMLSLIALSDPGFSRLLGHFTHPPKSAFPWFLWVFYGDLLLIALIAIWDWRRGRLMRQFVFGATGLIAAFYIAALLYFWPPWQALTTGWVQAWARAM